MSNKGIFGILLLIGIANALTDNGTATQVAYWQNATHISTGLTLGQPVNITVANGMQISTRGSEPTLGITNTGGGGGATFYFRDLLSGAYWKFKATTVGGFKIRDQNYSFDVLTFEANATANMIYGTTEDKLGFFTSQPNYTFDINSPDSIARGDFTVTGVMNASSYLNLPTYINGTIANCPDGLVVQNITATGLQCVAGGTGGGGTSDGTGGWTNTTTTTSTTLNVSINGTFMITASDNTTMMMCLYVSQDGTVGAYQCGTTPRNAGDNMVGEMLILAGVALIYIGFRGGEKHGSD